MRVNEVLDPDRKAALDAAKANIERQYQKHPVAQIDHKKRAYVQARQEQLRGVLGDLAKDFDGDRFEEFKKQALGFMTPEDHNLVDLQSVFNQNNPDMIQRNHDQWNDYAKSRDVDGQSQYTGD